MKPTIDPKIEPDQQRDGGDEPLVSVVLIFLNAERFLQEAIESVFAQTYRAWELILMDDGSTDESTHIAQRYAGNYPERVRYLSHPGRQNLGKWKSRILGASHAKGEFVAFLDADDVWLPYKLEQQVGILLKQPEAAMLYGTTQYWFSWTGKPEDRQRDFIVQLRVSPGTLIYPPDSILSYFIRQTYAVPSMSNIIVRRSGVEDFSRHEDSFQETLFEDQALYAMICHRAPVLAANACWDRYRQHPDSSTSDAMRRGIESQAREYFLNWLQSFLTAEGSITPEINKGIERERFLHRHHHLQKYYRRIRKGIPTLKSLPFLAAARILPASVYHRMRAFWRGEK